MLDFSFEFFFTKKNLIKKPSERKERKRNRQAVAPQQAQSKRARMREAKRMKRKAQKAADGENLREKLNEIGASE